MRFSVLRQNLVRIPEIYDFLSRAQKIWDQIPNVKPISFDNLLYRSDEFFESQPEVFDLLTDLVQLGMITRLSNKTVKVNYKYFVSSAKNSKADLVYLGKLSLKDLILQSPVVKNYSLIPQKIRLIGQSNKQESFRIFRKSDCGLKLLEINTNIEEILQNHLHEATLINLSIGHSNKIQKATDDTSIELQDFLQADGQLQWFKDSMLEIQTVSN